MNKKQTTQSALMSSELELCRIRNIVDEAISLLKRLDYYRPFRPNF